MESKHCGYNTSASWKGRAFSLCEDSLSLSLSRSLFTLSFPHQTPASTDDALKQSLCGLHTKQCEAAFKSKRPEKWREVSNTLLSMHK